jgi:hypothetical protein
MSEDEKFPLTIHSYEVVKKQQFMLEAAREYLIDTDPWRTDADDLKDEECIRFEDFEEWKGHLYKILGVKVDELSRNSRKDRVLEI